MYIYICIYVCMYGCMYVCMYVYIYMQNIQYNSILRSAYGTDTHTQNSSNLRRIVIGRLDRDWLGIEFCIGLSKRSSSCSMNIPSTNSSTSNPRYGEKEDVRHKNATIQQQTIRTFTNSKKVYE